MQEPDRIRLQHMRDAAREALSFYRGRSRADLDTDRMLLLAIVRAIEILGEAAGQVSPGTRRRLASIPWASIRGMRNRLIHAYFDIDLDVVCRTVEGDLPELLGKVEAALAKDPGPPPGGGVPGDRGKGDRPGPSSRRG